MSPKTTLGAVVLVISLFGALVSVGGAQYGGGSGGFNAGDGGEGTGDNPCLGPERRRLLCPDLSIARPSELYISLTPRGRRLLHATNDLRSRGDGPVEIAGRRVAKRSMLVTQRIHRKGGGKLAIRTTGRIDFYPIPGQYAYWKFRSAAKFELWTVGGLGRPLRRVRVGPKLHYCLRDLERTRPGPTSPPGPVYPACSQDPTRRFVVLGTSVGWSDIYPSTYHENWINVTGLRGCFAFVHTVDPRNHIRESNEKNNSSFIYVRLPGGRQVANC